METVAKLPEYAMEGWDKLMSSLTSEDYHNPEPFDSIEADSIVLLDNGSYWGKIGLYKADTVEYTYIPLDRISNLSCPIEIADFIGSYLVLVLDLSQAV